MDMSGNNYAEKRLLKMFLTEDDVLMEIKTLVKNTSVRDLQLCRSVQWSGHCVVDHNPNTSQ